MKKDLYNISMNVSRHSEKETIVSIAKATKAKKIMVIEDITNDTGYYIEITWREPFSYHKGRDQIKELLKQ